AEGSRTLDLLNAIPLALRHTTPRPPTSGENIKQTPAVPSPVVVACRQVNPQRTRRVGRAAGVKQRPVPRGGGGSKFTPHPLRLDHALTSAQSSPISGRRPSRLEVHAAWFQEVLVVRQRARRPVVIEPEDQLAAKARRRAYSRWLISAIASPIAERSRSPGAAARERE